MRLLTACLSAALLVSAVFCLDATHRDAPRPGSRVHHDIARRALASNGTGTSSIGKRAFTNARATHYVAGMGACGKYNTGADFIVALNHIQFGSGYPGPNCFKKIRISYKGISAVAEIRDMCPGCGYGELDLTNGLFSHFVPLRTDIFYMSWEFIDARESEPDPPKSPPKPAVAPKSTATSTKHSTSTHKPASTHSSSHKPSTATTVTSSTSTRATPTPTQPIGPQNVLALQQAMLGMARLANAVNRGN